MEKYNRVRLMKKKIIYITLLILIFYIGALIYVPSNYDLDNVYDSVVYIESFNEDVIKKGSGFVYETKDNKNYIVTNYHVVRDSKDIYVYNTDQKKVKGNLINYDKDFDIAIISIENKLNLKGIKLGNSDKIKIGQDIYVVGTPIDIQYISTLSKGVISYKNRDISIRTSYGNFNFNAIQIDANIDVGNSGSPLLTKDGKVIGIIFVKEESSNTISFAIPINDIKKVLNNFKI